MYNVPVMKAYRVAEARAKFGELLDEAQGGETVVIERKGVRYTLRAEQPPRQRRPRAKLLTYVHPDVMSGQWTWVWGKHGLVFRARRKRR